MLDRVGFGSAPESHTPGGGRGRGQAASESLTGVCPLGVTAATLCPGRNQ